MAAIKMSAQGMATYFTSQLQRRGLPSSPEVQQVVLGIAQEAYQFGFYMAAATGTQGEQLLHAMGAQFQRTRAAQQASSQTAPAAAPVPAPASPPTHQGMPVQAQAATVVKPEAPGPLPSHNAPTATTPTPSPVQPNRGLTAHEPCRVPAEAPVFDPLAEQPRTSSGDAPESMTEAPEPMVPVPDIQF